MLKQCPKCQQQWLSLQQFLQAKNVDVIGFQPNCKDPLSGYVYFQHQEEQCQTSFVIKLSEFTSLVPNYNGVEFQFGQVDNCPGFCLNTNNKRSCDNAVCRGAINREIVSKLNQILKRNNVEGRIE
jgi:hypothetical protein